jgi:hypothetical protein
MKPADFFTLNDKGEPIPCERWVGPTHVRSERAGKWLITTVFMGLNLGLNSKAPVLWETDVFDRHDKKIDCRRCPGSREQAMAMHNELVRKYEELEQKQPKDK